MDTSSHDISDLARPLPPSYPIKSPSSVASSAVQSEGAAAAFIDEGPGSVLVSEIDLMSSTLNFSTPTSFSSGFDFQAGLHIVELLKSCDDEVKLLTLWKCIDICGMAREQEMRGNQLPVSVAWW